MVARGEGWGVGEMGEGGQKVQTSSYKIVKSGLPWWSSGKESALQCRGRRFNPWSGNKDPTYYRATKPARHNY